MESTSTLTKDDLLSSVRRARLEGALDQAKTSIFFARSIFRNDGELLLEHHLLLFEEDNLRGAADLMNQIIQQHHNQLPQFVIERILDLLEPQLAATSLGHSPSSSKSSSRRSINYHTSILFFKLLNEQDFERSCIESLDYLLLNKQKKRACALSSIIIERFPHNTQQLWLAAGLALESEKDFSSPLLNPKNIYRKFLVEQCLPKILRSNQLSPPISNSKNFPLPSFFAILDAVIHYYVATSKWDSIYLIGKALSPSVNITWPASTQSDIKEIQNGGKRGSSTQSLSVDQRKSIFENLRNIQGSSTEFSYDNIENVLRFFLLVALFHHSLWEYYSSIVYGGAQKRNLIEIYKIDTATTSHKGTGLNGHQNGITNKKRKINETSFIQIRDQKKNLEAMNNLELSHDCWKVLSTDSLFQDQFTKFRERWLLDNWDWTHLSLGDMFFYKKDYKNAAQNYEKLARKLDEILVQSGQMSEQTSVQNTILSSKYAIELCMHRSRLQIGVCQLHDNDVKNAQNTFFGTLKSLPFTNQSAANVRNLTGVTHSSSEEFTIVTLSDTQLIAQSIHYLIQCYEILKDPKQLILYQFAWPFYRRKFQEFVKLIDLSVEFRFELFFDYIANVDILKEFAFLIDESDNKSSIILLPGNRSAPVTKEQLQAMLENQVVNSSTPEMSVTNLLSKFFASG